MAITFHGRAISRLVSGLNIVMTKSTESFFVRVEAAIASANSTLNGRLKELPALHLKSFGKNVRAPLFVAKAPLTFSFVSQLVPCRSCGAQAHDAVALPRKWPNLCGNSSSEVAPLRCLRHLALGALANSF